MKKKNNSNYFKTLDIILNDFKLNSPEYKSYIDEMTKGDPYYWIGTKAFRDWYDPKKYDDFKLN